MDENDTQQGPPPFMQAIMQGAPPQGPQQVAPQQNALPPTSPVDPDQIAAQAMQRGTQLTEEQLQRGHGPGDKAVQLATSPWETPDPKFGFQPKMVHGQGAGGFFHNLGQALITLGAATTPGQAVQDVVYGPGQKARGYEMKTRAEEIDALQKAQHQEYEPVGATARMGPAYMGAEARMIGARSGQERAQAYVQSVKDRAANMVKNWDLKGAALDEKKRHSLVGEAQQAANEAGRTYRSLHKDATTEDVAAVMSGTRTQIANEAAARDPSVKSWLFNALGIDVPQVQNAPSPEFRPTPKAGGPATPVKPTAKPSEGKGKKGVWNPKTGQVEWK